MHVLVTSNHWGIQDRKTFAGNFVDKQISALRDAGITITPFDIGTNYSPGQLFQKWRELRAIIDRKGIDIVHARYGTIVAFLSVLSGPPTVITFGGSDLLPGASVSKLQTHLGILLSNLASLFAKKLICVSEEMRKALWWRSETAIVIPDGVNLRIFIPGDQSKARAKLGWTGAQPIAIINAARDPENKGLPLARKAMELVRQQIPHAELKIIEGIPPDDMPLCYQAADVLISASRQEGSPNVIKEALACNLPVVATPVGDSAERLQGVTFSKIVPRQPVQMAEALVEILQKRERSNGREHVLNLGLDDVARRVIEVYQSLIISDEIYQK